MFIMTMYWTSSTLTVPGPRSRSQWIFLEKHFHRSSAFIYELVLIELHRNVKYDNIFHKLEFGVSWTKIKIKVAIFRKKKVIALATSFMNRFYFIQMSSMTVSYYSSNLSVCVFQRQGPVHNCFF